MNISFILYTEYYDQLSALSDEQFGKLMRAVFQYQKDGETTVELDVITKMAFSFIRGNLDRSNEKYNKSVENGKKGGRPKSNSQADESPVENIVENIVDKNIKNQKNLIGNETEKPKVIDSKTQGYDKNNLTAIETENLNKNDNKNINDNVNETNPPTSLTGVGGGYGSVVGGSEKGSEKFSEDNAGELAMERDAKNAARAEMREYYAQKTGEKMPTDISVEIISCFAKGFEGELIKEMLCIAVDKGKDRLKYFKAIARNLYGEGVLTYADFCKRGLPHNGNNGNGSFDTDEFFEAALKKSKATSFKSESETA